jgi:hypothetical protein
MARLVQVSETGDTRLEDKPMRIVLVATCLLGLLSPPAFAADGNIFTRQLKRLNNYLRVGRHLLPTAEKPSTPMSHKSHKSGPATWFVKRPGATKTIALFHAASESTNSVPLHRLASALAKKTKANIVSLPFCNDSGLREAEEFLTKQPDSSVVLVGLVYGHAPVLGLATNPALQSKIHAAVGLNGGRYSPAEVPTLHVVGWRTDAMGPMGGEPKTVSRGGKASARDLHVTKFFPVDLMLRARDGTTGQRKNYPKEKFDYTPETWQQNVKIAETIDAFIKDPKGFIKASQ